MQAEKTDTIGTRGRGEVGGPDAFEAAFFDHATRLVRLAALLGDDDPEDTVQESFAKLYGARHRLRGDEARVVAYLNKIVVNEVRSRQRHRRVVSRDAHLFVAPDVVDHAGPDAERRAVVAALSALPLRQREALVLRFWMDLPLGAVAEVMGVRVGTVKSQVSRGLQIVGAALREEATS